MSNGPLWAAFGVYTSFNYPNLYSKLKVYKATTHELWTFAAQKLLSPQCPKINGFNYVSPPPAILTALPVACWSYYSLGCDCHSFVHVCFLWMCKSTQYHKLCDVTALATGNLSNQKYWVSWRGRRGNSWCFLKLIKYVGVAWIVSQT